jgi:hypothetical protein
VLAEATLRAAAAWSGDDPAVRQALSEAKLIPGQDYGAGLKGNRLGYPGPEFPVLPRPGRRIAALGDSFAVGPTVRFADNYLTRLETLLADTRVYNLAVSGAGPREYARILEDAWPLSPDLVLVSLFVTNDVSESLPLPRRLDPRRSHLYQALRPLPAPRPTPLAPLSDDEVLAERIRTGTLPAEDYRRLEAHRLSVCTVPTPPAVERKWRATFARLDRIVAACRARGIASAFVLIPDEVQVNPDVLADVVGCGQVDRARLDLDLPQRRLAAFFAEHGVPCLDLLPTFKGRRDLYVPRNTHWNEAGNRLAAEALAKWLAPQR